LRLSYLRTKDDAEIDLIIERPDRKNWLVEIKATTQVSDEEAAKVERFLPDFPNSTAVVLSNDNTPRTVGRTRVLPWQRGIREILGL
jgi:predicted AAA+ superfamily ATPase